MAGTFKLTVKNSSFYYGEPKPVVEEIEDGVEAVSEFLNWVRDGYKVTLSYKPEKDSK